MIRLSAIAVLGAQWGDEGKGKVVHLLARDAAMAVRFNGGTNAGHTVVDAEGTFKFHLIPAGALYEDCIGVLGNGMVIDPWALTQELKALVRWRESEPEIFISREAHLILPYHPIVEELEGAADQIGTTRKGIGPAYRDKMARTGIRCADLFDPELLRGKIETNLNRLKRVWKESQALQTMDAVALAAELLELLEPIRERITDTAALVNRAVDRGELVLFEGAQGALLDIDFGTYPYVTSSTTTIGGIGVGAGVPPTKLDRVIGVTKAYTTRVGTGPFPTEEHGRVGERLREIGNEFGTTTGRPRRCGWLDLVALRYAARINGFTELALTKIDVLSNFDRVRVAIRYELDGKPLGDFPSSSWELERCVPIYETLDGWGEDISRYRSRDKLPSAVRHYVDFIAEQLELPITTISVGPAVMESIG